MRPEFVSNETQVIEKHKIRKLHKRFNIAIYAVIYAVIYAIKTICFIQSSKTEVKFH